MNLLLIYFVLVLLLAGFSAIAVFSFWRYRFKGDKTAIVIVLFTVAFGLTIGMTLFQLDPAGLSERRSPSSSFDNF